MFLHVSFELEYVRGPRIKQCIAVFCASNENGLLICYVIDEHNNNIAYWGFW